MSTREIWHKWRNDPKAPFYKIGERRFYWAHKALFEKFPGVTSGKLGKYEASFVFDAMKENKGEFIASAA